MSLLKTYLEEENTGQENAVAFSDQEYYQALEDIQKAEDEVEEVEDDIDEMEDAEAGLEAIAADLEATLENGGVDPVGAAFAQQAVSAYGNRLGLTTESMMPALESFGGDSGREASTQVSVEGIKEQLVKIWNAIKAAVQKSIKAVTDFFAKIFGGVKKVISKLEEAKKSLDDMGSDYELKKDAEINVPQGETLRYNGKLDSGSIKKGLEALKDLANKVFNDGIDAGVKQIGSVMDAIEEAKKAKSDEDLEAALKELADGNEVAIKVYGKLEKDLVAGDKVIVSEVKNGRTTTSLETSEKAKSLDGKASKQKPFELSDLKSMIDTSISTLKIIDKQDKAVEKLNKAREDAIKAADKAVADADKNAAYNVWEKAKSRVVLKSVQADVAKPSRQVAKHAFSTGRAVLSLVDAGKKAYTKKGDDKKED